jgi:hypothetical protein
MCMNVYYTCRHSSRIYCAGIKKTAFLGAHRGGLLIELCPPIGDVVLVNVANDPYTGQVGNGKGRGRPGERDLRRRGLGYDLLNDYAGDRRVNWNDRGGMVLVDTQSLKLILGGFQIFLGVLSASSACSSMLNEIAP